MPQNRKELECQFPNVDFGVVKTSFSHVARGKRVKMPIDDTGSSRIALTR